MGNQFSITSEEILFESDIPEHANRLIDRCNSINRNKQTHIFDLAKYQTKIRDIEPSIIQMGINDYLKEKESWLIKIGFFFTERRGGEIIFNGNKECILITGKFDAIEKFMKDVEEEQQVQEQKENKELKERVDALEALLKLK